MNFPSINIQGSILSHDLLGKIRSEQASYQQGKDFIADLTNAKLKDEISLAWQEAKGQKPNPKIEGIAPSVLRVSLLRDALNKQAQPNGE